MQGVQESCWRRNTTRYGYGNKGARLPRTAGIKASGGAGGQRSATLCFVVVADLFILSVPECVPMRKAIRITGLLLALTLSGCDFEHQAEPEMVSTTQSRPIGDEASVDADISFRIGNLEISSDSPSVLYSLDLEYDKANFEPQVHYDAVSGNRGRLSAKLESAHHVGS